ncbi:hypothetical protein BD779DRAFT_1682378 [Infundibulicybe gibba]|nr:hypothetical protein BD779DRAFT_1682378 [Infundibulicybe gibba]
MRIPRSWLSTQYHEWIELRTLTASEPLMLAEEYTMRAKWREDEDKLTTIFAGTWGVEIPTNPGHYSEEPAYRRQSLALESLRLLFAYKLTTRPLGLGPGSEPRSRATTAFLTAYPTHRAGSQDYELNTPSHRAV